MPEQFPTGAQAAFEELRAACAELDEQLAVAYETPLPEGDPTDPDALAEHAGSPDAPAELRAVATAVREGRTSWEAVASGEGRDVPEVQALRAAGIAGLRQHLMDEPAPAVGPDPEPAEPDEVTDDDYFRNQDFLDEPIPEPAGDAAETSTVPAPRPQRREEPEDLDEDDYFGNQRFLDE